MVPTAGSLPPVSTMPWSTAHSSLTTSFQGAAASLKYAKAQDLPGFPSVGIETTKSGNKAANLAFDNQKSFEYWKPEASTSAGRAALLAANAGGKVDLWQYKADGTGNTAASAAMGRNSSPQLDYGYTETGQKNSLLAATKSLKISDTPVQSIGTLSGGYPDAQNATSNALNAATIANRPSTRSSADLSRMSERGMEASRVQNMTGVSREMYGSSPNVGDPEEKARQAALRASAISMAKSLYEIEKPAMERIAAGDSAARKAHAEHFNAQQSGLGGDPLKAQAMNYVKVQELAQKLASERLAKLDPDGVMAYQEHYGYGRTAQTSKLSIRGRRGRSGSNNQQDEYDSSDDELQAARIKTQQSRFNQTVADVDQEKRATDRKNLMVAAQKSVQARMATMDQKVFADTGKVSPAMMAEWEAQAQAKAAANSEERMLTHGKVHIGGGRYMDQSEIDAIAAARLQPTLDEISNTAELQRAREAEIKADQERRAEATRVEKQRQADLKKEQSKPMPRESSVCIKPVLTCPTEEQKAAEKAEAKKAKEDEKLRLAEEKRAKKEAEQRATEHKTMVAAVSADSARLHQEHLGHSGEVERARAAEAEAAERERLADERIAAAEQEVAQQEAAEREAAAEHAAARQSISSSEPDVEEALAADHPVTSVDSDRPSTGKLSVLAVELNYAKAHSVFPTEVSPPASPSSDSRGSKLRGLFSRISRSSKTDTAPPAAVATSDASTTVPATETSVASTTAPAVDSNIASTAAPTVESDIASASVPAAESSVETPAAPVVDPSVSEAEAFKSGTGEGSESAELTSRAKGKEPADEVLDPVSDVEPDEDMTRGRGSMISSSNDQWEEARDRFDDDVSTPRASYARESATGSPSRVSSKFQEQL